MSNGAGATVRPRRDRELEREEKEKEKLKTSQVGRGLGCVGWQSLGHELSLYL